MIVYKFPVKDFLASEGYVSITVKDHKLELKEKPDTATLALIERHSGKVAVKEVKKRQRNVRRLSNGSHSP